MTDEVIAIGAAIAAVKNFVDLAGKLGDGLSKEHAEAMSHLYEQCLRHTAATAHGTE